MMIQVQGTACFPGQFGERRKTLGPMIKALCNAIDGESTAKGAHMRVLTEVESTPLFFTFELASLFFFLFFFFFFFFFVGAIIVGGVLDHVIIGVGLGPCLFAFEHYDHAPAQNIILILVLVNPFPRWDITGRRPSRPAPSTCHYCLSPLTYTMSPSSFPTHCPGCMLRES